MLCNKRGVYFIFTMACIDSKIDFGGALLVRVIQYCLYFSETRIPPPWSLNDRVSSDVRHSRRGRYTPSTAACHRSRGDSHCRRRRRRRRRRESKSLINFFDLPASAVSVSRDRRRRTPRTIT